MSSDNNTRGRGGQQRGRGGGGGRGGDGAQQQHLSHQNSRATVVASSTRATVVLQPPHSSAAPPPYAGTAPAAAAADSAACAAHNKSEPELPIDVVDNRILYEQEKKRLADEQRRVEEREAARLRALLQEQQQREATLREQQREAEEHEQHEHERRSREAAERQRALKEEQEQRKREKLEQQRRENQERQRREVEEKQRKRQLVEIPEREQRERQRCSREEDSERSEIKTAAASAMEVVRRVEDERRQREDKRRNDKVLEQLRRIPLGARLLQEGLSAAEITLDKWMALSPLFSEQPELIDVVFDVADPSGSCQQLRIIMAATMLNQMQAMQRLMKVTPSTPKSVELLCVAIGNLSLRPPDAIRRSDVVVVVDTLVAVSRAAPITPETCYAWCRTLLNVMMGNHEFNDLYITPRVRDVFVCMSAGATTVNASVLWSSALRFLAARTPANVLLFATPAFRSALCTVASFATTRMAGAMWCSAVANVCCGKPQHQALLANDSAFRKVLLKVHRLCGTASQWSEAVGQLVRDVPANRLLLGGDVAWRAALVSSGRSIASRPACAEWLAAMSWLLVETENQRRFGEPLLIPLRDALLSIRRFASASAHHWCDTLSLLASIPANAALLGTPELRDAVVAMGQRMATEEPEQRIAWCGSLISMTGSEAANVALFRTSAVWRVLSKMQPHLKTDDEMHYWRRAMKLFDEATIEKYKKEENDDDDDDGEDDLYDYGDEEEEEEEEEEA